MKMQFKTVEKADLNHLNEFLNIPKDVDIEYDGDLTIDFELTPDETRFGLNGIDISIKSISGLIEWEIYDDESLTPEEKAAINTAGGALMNNNYYSGSFELNVTDTDPEWTIENETEFTSTGSFYFDGVEIDFKKKIITL